MAVLAVGLMNGHGESALKGLFANCSAPLFGEVAAVNDRERIVRASTIASQYQMTEIRFQ